MESETESIDKPISTVFVAESLESSEDPPMDQWSSLEMVVEQRNPKRVLEEEGLYDPGAPDICSKYITLSASSVFRHVYYKYPALLDPGLVHALLDPEDIVTYPDDGQDLYLAVCKDMKQCVVKKFHEGLLSSVIDLCYYGINPNGVRAMAMALKHNCFVKKLNLTDNFLNIDASWHLGDMFTKNTYLVELNLTGCRIGPTGARQLLHNLPSNKTLEVLNLSRNEIGDDGMVYFADAVFKGLNVKDINLSHNDIGERGISLLAEPFQAYNKIVNWDLSWNNLYSTGSYVFFNALADTSTELNSMNLSWNSLGPLSGWGLMKLLKTKEIKYLDLSNNLLKGEGIKIMCKGLSSAKKLKFLDASNNPMTADDALRILKKMKLRAVKVSCVRLDNITVDQTFMLLLKEVRELKPTLNFTYGYVLGSFKALEPDIRQILFRRVDYLCKKPKKKKVDFVLFLLELQKNKVVYIMVKELSNMLTQAGALLDPDLMTELCNLYSGPKTGKGEKTVNINGLVEYCSRMFPERKLPPTPPPELEPEPPLRPSPAPTKKGKGKAKK